MREGCGKDRRIGYGRFQRQPEPWSQARKTIRRILNVGAPGAVEVFVRSGSSVAFMGVMARTARGRRRVAAHTIGPQMETFPCVPSLGIGGAATRLVGPRAR